MHGPTRIFWANLTPVSLQPLGCFKDSNPEHDPEELESRAPFVGATSGATLATGESVLLKVPHST
jgi:hypothetical protein